MYVNAVYLFNVISFYRSLFLGFVSRARLFLFSSSALYLLLSTTRGALSFGPCVKCFKEEKMSTCVLGFIYGSWIRDVFFFVFVKV